MICTLQTRGGDDIRVGEATTYLDGSVFMGVTEGSRYVEVILSPADAKALRKLLQPSRRRFWKVLS